MALIFHVRIKDQSEFDIWQLKIREQAEELRGRRVYAGDVDPAMWDGMLIDVILIDELPNAKAAADLLQFAFDQSPKANEVLSVLAIDPIPRFALSLIRRIARIASKIAPLSIKDESNPIISEEEMKNPEIWGNPELLNIALEQDQSSTLFMYNLNKFNKQAIYDPPLVEGDPNVSGVKAYNRYGKPMDQFRRGTYPTYVGRVIGQFSDVDDDPLEDDWH